MNKIFSKILIFSILLISLNAVADWYMEKINASASNEGLEKIWIKNNLYKSETNRISLIYNAANDSLRYENHLIRSYWEGSFDDWISQGNKKPIPSKGKKNRKIKTKKSTPLQDIILIKPMEDSMEIAGLMGKKYLVIVNGKTKEEFYYYPKININNNKIFSKINAIKEIITPSKTKYRLSKEYFVFIRQGLILKRVIIDTSGLYLDDMEMMMTNSEEIDPSVFLVPTNYQPMPLEQILKIADAESKDIKKD